MKKVLAFLLTAVMLLSLTACVAKINVPGLEDVLSNLSSGSDQSSRSDAASEPDADSERDADSEPDTDSEPDEFHGGLDPIYIYDGLVQDHARLFAVGEGIGTVFDEYSTVADLASMYGEECLQTVGYYIGDVVGDWLPELVIGSLEPENSEAATAVYAMYTLGGDDGLTPVKVLDSNQNLYWYWANGELLQTLYGGTHECIGIFRFGESMSELTCSEFYYYTLMDPEAEGGWYNTTGRVDEEQDQAISEEVLNEAIQMLGQRTGKLDGLIAFADYEGLDNALGVLSQTEGMDFPLIVGWAAEVTEEYPEWDVLTVHALEGQEGLVSVAFDGRVTDFRLFSLTPADVDGDSPMYVTEEIYYQEVLDRPIEVGLIFYGDTPSWGVSCIDEAGRLRQFAVSIRGDDGGLYLAEF